MAEVLDAVLADLISLPPAGTPERLDWDATIREAIELYPDWAAITIGTARFRRETYEQYYKECYEEEESLLCAAAGH
jgi:hypothetical protein